MKVKPMIVTRVHQCSTCPTTSTQEDGEYDRNPSGWSVLYYLTDETIKLCAACTLRLKFWLEGQAK